MMNFSRISRSSRGIYDDFSEISRSSRANYDGNSRSREVIKVEVAGIFEKKLYYGATVVASCGNM